MNKKLKKLNYDKVCYKLLCEVFISGAYSTLVLGTTLKRVPLPEGRSYITRLFYGTLEKSIQFDYIIKQLTDKSPQRSVKVLLKMGLYMLRYMDMPDYAAIDRIVELSKQVGKTALSGFINAVLRKSVDIEIPSDNLSATLSYPNWVIEKLLVRYDQDFIRNNLTRKESTLRHIRRNALKISQQEFEDKIGEVEKSALGYLINSTHTARLNSADYTYQSLSSMLAVKAYLSGQQCEDVLDICAAPGGKSIYLKELCPSSNIICCDALPHRVELIEKYATRMGADLELSCADATLLNVEWLNRFDLVICDVPCSGLGVHTKPDVLLNRKKTDSEQLSALQYDILHNASNYVKVGGVLCYSTCTFIMEENEDVINRFLKEKDNYILTEIIDESIDKNKGMVNLFPIKYNSDSFFIARMKRVK